MSGEERGVGAKMSHWKKTKTVTNILLSITGEKPQPTICKRQNQRSGQMSNGPGISFEDTATLAHTHVSNLS